MRKLALTAMLAGVVLTQACMWTSKGTELGQVAKTVGMSNITTGDGTFENYTAVDWHKGTEIGIGVGIPFIWKALELYPAKSNEALMGDVASRAKSDGADAMINVCPVQELYTGIPFFFAGVYIDTAAGTGIKTK